MVAQALGLLAFASLGLVLAQVPPGDADHGDDPDIEEMILARAATERQGGVQADDLTSLYIIIGLNGTRYEGITSTHLSIPYTQNLSFSELNFTNALKSTFGGTEQTHAVPAASYHQIPLANRAANNLGGMGPNNGVYSYTAGFISIQPSQYQPHPNFIRMNDVTTMRGTRVAMRIDNTSEYKAAKPAMNDFNGFNFQVNLQPLYNTSAGATPDDLDYQPFKSVGLTGAIGDRISNFITQGLGITLQAENCNSVSLFYSFFDQDTGSPVELEEVRRHALCLRARGSPRTEVLERTTVRPDTFAVCLVFSVHDHLLRLRSGPRR